MPNSTERMPVGFSYGEAHIALVCGQTVSERVPRNVGEWLSTGADLETGICWKGDLGSLHALLHSLNHFYHVLVLHFPFKTRQFFPLRD